MKKQFLILTSATMLSLALFSCGGNEPTTEPPEVEAKSMIEEYDPTRGEGKFDETNVNLGAIDEEMAAKGEVIAQSKCFACHKITDEKLVGPGWKGVTSRYTPHWIMNFILNPDSMLDKDPVLKKQVELYKTRMPNQNLTENEARQVLEFLRKNDGVK